MSFFIVRGRCEDVRFVKVKSMVEGLGVCWKFGSGKVIGSFGWFMLGNMSFEVVFGITNTGTIAIGIRKRNTVVTMK